MALTFSVSDSVNRIYESEIKLKSEQRWYVASTQNKLGFEQENYNIPKKY